MRRTVTAIDFPSGDQPTQARRRIKPQPGHNVIAQGSAIVVTHTAEPGANSFTQAPTGRNDPAPMRVWARTERRLRPFRASDCAGTENWGDALGDHVWPIPGPKMAGREPACAPRSLPGRSGEFEGLKPSLLIQNLNSKIQNLIRPSEGEPGRKAPRFGVAECFSCGRPKSSA